MIETSYERASLLSRYRVFYPLWQGQVLAVFQGEGARGSL